MTITDTFLSDKEFLRTILGTFFSIILAPISKYQAEIFPKHFNEEKNGFIEEFKQNEAK